MNSGFLNMANCIPDFEFLSFLPESLVFYARPMASSGSAF